VWRTRIRTVILVLALAAGRHALPEEAHQRPALVSDSCAKPEYPEASRKAGETGTVLLNFLVDETGRVVESTIERSSGYPPLDEAAQSALRRCKFRPAIIDGTPTSARTRLEYVWTLKEPEPLKPPLLIAGSCKKPDYPQDSLRENEAGIVVLNFLVDEQGNALTVTIGSSSGYFRLDEAARTALQQCKFQPGTRDGKPTSASATIEYVWTLSRSGGGTIDDPTMGGFFPTRLPVKETPAVVKPALNSDRPSLVVSSCKKPEYPPEARNAGESGSVRLKFRVNENGEAVESAVVRSSGYPRLDDTARDALKLCKFAPAMQDGKPRAEWTWVEYEWSLMDEGRIKTAPVANTSSCQKPAYPAASRRANEMGNVVLSLLIDEGGSVISRKVERSSGYQRLDQAAAAGLSLCKFTPATIDGRPTRAWARIEYVWRLQ